MGYGSVTKGYNMELRPYQEECISEIESRPPGAYLVQLATGLGKTVIFTHLPRRGRTLLLSHREELVRQPLKYYTCRTAIEQGDEHADPDAEVVSASVQSLQNRLSRFGPEDFDTIICDEAHHAAARSYRKIFGYFRPRMLLGFTATPNRGDHVRLDDVFEDIIFTRDLRWGIENGYLSDIYCLRVNIGYDLSAVRTRNGDYAPGELGEAMEGTADAIAQAYRDYATGATLIFAVNIAQCHEIAARIPGAEVVTGETKDRADIIARFTAGDIPCLVNCMVFTEGTDIPRVETVIIARPTQSDSLYTQMVGRGLRLAPGKERLTLIDCVGVTGKADLCTAPSLLGIDLRDVPAKRQKDVQGMLFDLPTLAMAAADTPESWIKNVQVVDLWAKAQSYDLHGVNWYRRPDGSLTLSLTDRPNLTIPAPDALGRVCIDGETYTMQQALDSAYRYLRKCCADQRTIWSTDSTKHWGKAPATEKQLAFVRRLCARRGLDVPPTLTKSEAGCIIDRLSNGGGKRAC